MYSHIHFCFKNKLYKNSDAETGKTKLEQIKNNLRLSKTKKQIKMFFYFSFKSLPLKERQEHRQSHLSLIW